eukprot:1714937-Prymnesium_polylepis.1
MASSPPQTRAGTTCIDLCPEPCHIPRQHHPGQPQAPTAQLPRRGSAHDGAALHDEQLRGAHAALLLLRRVARGAQLVAHGVERGLHARQLAALRTLQLRAHRAHRLIALAPRAALAALRELLERLARLTSVRLRQLLLRAEQLRARCGAGRAARSGRADSTATAHAGCSARRRSARRGFKMPC